MTRLVKVTTGKLESYGEFELKDVSQDTYDDYLVSFFKIAEDNPQLVPPGSSMSEFLKSTVSKLCPSYVLLHLKNIYSLLSVIANFVPESIVVDSEGNSIPVEDLDSLKTDDVDVEFSIGLCDTAEGRDVRFIVDKLTVNS